MRLLLTHSFALLLVFLSFVGNASAASWKVASQDDELIAITPQHGLMVKMIKPKSGIWGKLYVPVNEEQVENLKKHRLDKYFSFVSVGIEIDGYTRNANAKVIEKKKLVRIELDQRSWDLLKKGSKLIIHLPEGSTYKERLRGSSKALQKLERKIYSQY